MSQGVFHSNPGRRRAGGEGMSVWAMRGARDVTTMSSWPVSRVWSDVEGTAACRLLALRRLLVSLRQRATYHFTLLLAMSKVKGMRDTKFTWQLSILLNQKFMHEPIGKSPGKLYSLVVSLMRDSNSNPPKLLPLSLQK